MKTTEKLYGILNQAKELGVVTYKEKLIQDGKFRLREDDHYDPQKAANQNHLYEARIRYSELSVVAIKLVIPSLGIFLML